MSVNPVTLADLRATTPPAEIKQRPTFRKVNGVRTKGPDLSYVDARYVMDRLDEVVGPENWRDDYAVLPDGSVVCELSVKVTRADAEGEVTATEWVSKSDVGVPSTIEPQKGAFSDALKRAGVKWGIARDLYEEREEEMADTRPIRERTSDAEDDLPYAAPAATTGRRPGSGASTAARPRNGAAPDKAAQDLADYNTFMATFDPENSPWYCPDHDTVRVGEPFVKDGKAIGGSLKCDRGWGECKQTGPWMSDLVRTRTAG